MDSAIEHQQPMDQVNVMPFTCAAYVDDQWRELQQQRELAWDLDAISDRGEALAFLRRFENCLCIYSAYAQSFTAAIAS